MLVKDVTRANFPSPCSHYYLEGGEGTDLTVCRQLLLDLLKQLRISVSINQYGLSHSESYLFSQLSRNRIVNLSVMHSSPFLLYNHWLQYVLNFTGLQFIVRMVLFFVLKERYKRKRIEHIQMLDERVDAIVTLSSDFTQQVKKYAHKCQVFNIPNPVATLPSIEFLKKEGRLLYVGRLEKMEKSPQFLLPIYEEVSNSFPHYHLDIVGDGPYRKELESLFKQRGLSNYTFHGFTDPVPFYKRAQVLLMTSKNEGFGMVLIEAMSYGVIPFAFNSFATLKDIIDDGVNGFSIPPFDTKEYSSKICNLLNHSSTYSTMQQKALEKAAFFHVEKIVDRWEILFDKLRKDGLGNH